MVLLECIHDDVGRSIKCFVGFVCCLFLGVGLLFVLSCRGEISVHAFIQNWIDELRVSVS